MTTFKGVYPRIPGLIPTLQFVTLVIPILAAIARSKMNNNTHWSLGLILLHWGSALAIIVLFTLGLWMTDLDYYHPWYRRGPELHESIGLWLGGFTLLRLFLRIKGRRPQPLGTGIEQLLARLGHLGLYILLVAVLISGYLLSTAEGNPLPLAWGLALPGLGRHFDAQLLGDMHEFLAIGLIVLAIVHALAALKHHFIDRDPTLTRMFNKTFGEKQ